MIQDKGSLRSSLEDRCQCKEVIVVLVVCKARAMLIITGLRNPGKGCELLLY